MGLNLLLRDTKKRISCNFGKEKNKLLNEGTNKEWAEYPVEKTENIYLIAS